MSYTRGIRLKKFAQERYVAGEVDGYRLKIVAYGGYLMPDEIFRYLRRPYGQEGTEEVDEFDGVCSPADLEEYPVGSPSGIPKFFRKAEVDLVFRSQSLAEDAWEIIKKEVGSLVDTLNIMEELREEENIVYGNPPPP